MLLIPKVLLIAKSPHLEKSNLSSHYITSYSSFFRKPTGPKAHWSESPLVRNPIGNKAHWSKSPLVCQLIGYLLSFIWEGGSTHRPFFLLLYIFLSFTFFHISSLFFIFCPFRLFPLSSLFISHVILLSFLFLFFLLLLLFTPPPPSSPLWYTSI